MFYIIKKIDRYLYNNYKSKHNIAFEEAKTVFYPKIIKRTTVKAVVFATAFSKY